MIPEGYHAVTPWVIGNDTAGLIDFLTAAFGAEELGRMTDENGLIGHAEVRIGDSVVMMFDKPDWPPTPAFLRVYVDDVDATFERAVAAGATVVTDLTHMFWGDLVGRLADPFGNLYWVQSWIENVDEDELARRLSDPAFTKAMQYVQSTLVLPENPRTGRR